MNETQIIDGDAILEQIFRVVLQEARVNKAFAHRLIESLPKQAVLRIQTTKRPSKPKSPAVSLVKLLRMEGDDAVMSFLKRRNRKQLKSIAERQQLPVREEEFSGELPYLRTSIIEAVKFRIADRRAASS
ncbi:MAG: hypothetical protein SGJ17_07705 [Hyphomicrobiales bacterium]|nr:hypothetical protein [Hyphomicrobiales bacterium]